MRDVHIRSLAESMRMECGPQLSLAQRKGTTRCPWMICKGESGLDFLQSSLSLSTGHAWRRTQRSPLGRLRHPESRQKERHFPRLKRYSRDILGILDEILDDQIGCEPCAQLVSETFLLRWCPFQWVKGSAG